MNPDKLPKFMVSMMNALQNMAMQMLGNIAAKYLIYLQLQRWVFINFCCIYATQ